MSTLYRSLVFLTCLALPAVALAQEQPSPSPEPSQPEQPQPPADEQQPAAETPQAGFELFPLQQGFRWYYQVRFSIEPKGGGEQTLPPEERVQKLEVRVESPQPVGGEPATVVEWRLDGDLSQRCYFVVREGAVRCVKRIQGFGEHMKEFDLEPAQPVVQERLQVGQTWSWEGKVNGVASRQVFTVLREEKVQTPAGTFPAVVVEVQFTGEDGSKGWTRRWLAPGIGLVKDKSEVETPDSVFKTEGVLTRYETPGS